jgi:hypothetical protein
MIAEMVVIAVAVTSTNVFALVAGLLVGGVASAGSAAPGSSAPESLSVQGSLASRAMGAVSVRVRTMVACRRSGR